MTGYRPARQFAPINPHRAEGRMVKARGIGAKGFALEVASSLAACSQLFALLSCFALVACFASCKYLSASSAVLLPYSYIADTLAACALCWLVS